MITQPQTKSKIDSGLPRTEFILPRTRKDFDTGQPNTEFILVLDWFWADY